MPIFLLLLPALLLASPSFAAERGTASVYWANDGSQQGSVVACPGYRLSDSALTAAHPSAPCGSRLRVTNTANGKAVTITVIDRGPFKRGRIVDLTRAAARALGFSGLAPVIVERQ